MAQTSANIDRIRKAHAFLVEREQASTTFTKADLIAATGWKLGTITTYLSKKWAKIVRREGAALHAVGALNYGVDEFVRLMSQRDEISSEPKKPQLKPEVEALLRKAREAALLALQIYNNPVTIFRTEGFTVMMVIAWTALLHAIFERRGEPYFYLDSVTGKPQLIDGDKKAWDLAESVSHHYGANTTPARKNVEFIVRLRHKIEHRFVPEIDAQVAGECQAMIFNFDELLVAEFGTYYAIRESLAVPLQTAHVRTSAMAESLRKLQARHFTEMNEFLVDHRASLSPDILHDQRYRFSVFLIPKPANHPSASHAIEFVKVTPENEAKLGDLTKSIVAIQHRAVGNAGFLKATDVARRVADRICKTFNVTHHTWSWRRYNVHRPLKKKEKVTSDGCNTQFCVPDEVHNDYVFTPEWIEFLVRKLSDESEYNLVTKKKPSVQG